MKPTSEILERIQQNSTQHTDGVYTRLYRYLLREDIYYAAYQKLYANRGAGTKGINGDTADGFSNKYVETLISELKDGTYQAKPVRREYIPKKNGKKRPLGIPSFRDKLLQEVVRMILEAIYEPTFDNHSHGFRPNRSCHTALSQMKSEFTGVSWFIEGDIKGCFDNIDHEKLIEILARKIKDSKFINIIRQFLKAGYVENWKYNRTYSGTPQGGIISPILANIYLNELDQKVAHMKQTFDRPGTSSLTAEYHAMDIEIKRLSYWVAKTEDETARKELLAQLLKLKKQIRTIPSKLRDNKRMAYVRYADDWVIGVCGSRAECEAMKRELADYLESELHLTLSTEKTLITHSAEQIRFLGYDVSVRRNQEVKGGTKDGRKSRSLNLKVELLVPLQDKIERFLFEKGVVVQRPDGSLKPMHRTYMLNMSDSEIVERYNAEARGLLNYYHLACNYHTLDYFCYLMEYSCLKTLANKHKSSTRHMIQKYRDGKSWSVPYETKAGIKRVRTVKIADCKKGYANDVIFQPRKFAWKSTIRDRLNTGVCELCGKTNADLYEVHHVSALKSLGDSDWETIMKQKRRKTLVVCSECHAKIHG